jgi:hypothetical protein
MPVSCSRLLFGQNEFAEALADHKYTLIRLSSHFARIRTHEGSTIVVHDITPVQELSAKSVERTTTNGCDILMQAYAHVGTPISISRLKGRFRTTMKPPPSDAWFGVQETNYGYVAIPYGPKCCYKFMSCDK